MRATTLVSLLLAAAVLSGCGAATLHSDDARKELRDCRRVDDMGACESVGMRYATGDEADLNLDRALRFLRKACRNDPGQSCPSLALFALESPESGLTPEEVVAELERSCHTYSISGCSVLIAVLETPELPVYNLERAQLIRDRLCMLGFEILCYRDTDGDRIDDGIDGCVDDPEDYDAFEDSDGCPDLDNDGDGVPDEDDACPDIPEDADGFDDADGCIDFDNDRDEILDGDDTCPDDAEDFDGFEDSDGCPDLDNDRDGIADADDACTNEPEDFDGFEDADGCPEEGEGLVSLTCEQIEIREAVYFATGSDVIEARSFPLLDQVAGVLQAASYITLVEVAGHTDDIGQDDANLDLSQRRADSVRRYLVESGVAPERVRAVGYGETAPIVPNTSTANRTLNRRVEFRVVEQDANCGQ